MTLDVLLRVVRTRWRVVTAIAALCLLGAGLGWAARPVEYAARCTMSVFAKFDPTLGGAAQSAYQGTLLAQHQITSYVRLVNGHELTDAVVRRLALPMTADQLSSEITASSGSESTLIDIEVKDPDPGRAAVLANAVGAELATRVADLEGNGRPEDAPVGLQITQPALPPDAPSSPGLGVTLLVGLAIGLVLGGAGGVLRNALDQRIGSADQLGAAGGAAVLGVLSRRRPGEEPARGSIVARAVRRLRTNLHLVGLVDGGRVVAFVGDPGTRPRTVLEIAEVLAASGRRVLVVDGDTGGREITRAAGADGEPGLADVLAGRSDCESVVRVVSAVEILPAGSRDLGDRSSLAGGHFAGLVDDLRWRYDVILVNVPREVTSADGLAVVAAADATIVVAGWMRTTLRELEDLLEAVEPLPTPIAGTVLVGAPVSAAEAFDEAGIDIDLASGLDAGARAASGGDR